tara:strand:- start:18041 stop:18514 length:474 start_codon:yes stop_codon:yes gene_type:complete
VFNQRGTKISSLSRIDNSIESIKNRIDKLDQQIADLTKEIFNAQLVRARSMFSANTNFIQGFQKRIVESSVNNSLEWHKLRLREISNERNMLQDQLDRYTGKFWSKKIRKFFLFIVAWTFLALLFSVILLGFVAALYLLPVLALIVFSYIIIKKLNV